MQNIIEITKETFEQEVLKSDKPVLVEFYRPEGCGNCTTMKPVVEKFAEMNPNIKVCLYSCGKEQDPITKTYQFKMFPGIFSFVGGKPMRGLSGVKTLKQLSTVFVNIADLKLALADITLESQFLIKEITEFNQGTQIIYPQEPVITKENPAIPNDPQDDLQCDSCQ